MGPATVQVPGTASDPAADAGDVGRLVAVRRAVPMGLLAGGVAYSRVHTGVHYPGDVVVGSILGAGTAAVVVGAGDRLLDPGKPRS